MSDEQLFADAGLREGSGDAQSGGGVGSTTGAPGPADVDAGTSSTATPGAASPTNVPASSGASRVTGPDATPVKTSCARQLSPVKIATVGQQSGVVGSIIAGGPKAVQAWAADVNARGGLNCHPVQYVIRDDGGDPSRHQAQVKQLVEQEGVIAFVHMNAPLTGQSSQAYLNSKGIPVIGNEGAGTWFYDSPTYFPSASSGDGLFYAAMGAASARSRSTGKDKVAQYSCVETSACSRFYQTGPANAAAFGLQLVARGQVSIAQPDFTSTCQSAQSAGAEIVIVGLDTSSDQRFVRSCNSVNYHPIYVGLGDALTGPDLANDPSFDGWIFATSVLPWFSAEPAAAQFRTTLGRFAPGLPPFAAPAVGWASARLFEAATSALPEPPTSKSILDGLYAIRNNDLNGFTSPLTFAAGRKAPQTKCFWLVQIQNQKFVAANDGKRTCA